MHHSMQPVTRQSLADDLAQRVVTLIHESGLKTGERLPAIMEMARRFGVGHPTLREALRKLETLGVVSIRHGSGVYVKDQPLLVSNPVWRATGTKKQLLDLVEARTAVELAAVALAARHVTDAQLARMRELLDTASRSLGRDDAALSRANMEFHAEIASASGNAVLFQLLQVLSRLFEREQLVILGISGAPQLDSVQHHDLLDALAARDEARAVELMREHLDWVRQALLAWDDESQAGAGPNGAAAGGGAEAGPGADSTR